MSSMVVTDPVGSRHAARIDRLIAIEREKAGLDAEQQRLLAVLAASAHPYPGTDLLTGHQWVREEVACALSIAPLTAAERLHTATRLVDHHPDLLTALGSGEITLMHARVFLQHTRDIDNPTAQAVEARVLPRAAGKTISQFKQHVKRAVLALDPRGGEQRHTEATTQRYVSLRPEDNAMATIAAYLPADDALQIFHTLTRLAGPGCEHDPRTVDQRRADTLVDLLNHDTTTTRATIENGAAAGTGCGFDAADGPDATAGTQADPGSLVTAGARRQARRRARRWARTAAGPAIQVSVALSTLLGLDQQPADLDGYGPIPAVLARRIAADPHGTWRRLITDEYGQLLDYGRTVYRPPADLERYIRARDRTCRFPVCTQPAKNCELDHITAWTDGGHTNPANLHALSPRHHHAKHDAGWHTTRDLNGTTHWTSPAGHTYTTDPATYPVDTTTVNDPDPPPF